MADAPGDGETGADHVLSQSLVDHTRNNPNAAPLPAFALPSFQKVAISKDQHFAVLDNEKTALVASLQEEFKVGLARALQAELATLTLHINARAGVDPKVQNHLLFCVANTATKFQEALRGLLSNDLLTSLDSESKTALDKSKKNRPLPAPAQKKGKGKGRPPGPLRSNPPKSSPPKGEGGKAAPPQPRKDPLKKTAGKGPINKPKGSKPAAPKKGQGKKQVMK
ncbi:hypothetical protein BGZ65_010645 [Modicella reniformis]|uniref:Uncharacterized protein n=1 Tax=Modicella reniformis TaxID=1440133 RepID=A0A9P6IHZ8_9FUNG|nr:hypothetical protein BGZ65_010645 [Modicella reniformis]